MEPWSIHRSDSVRKCQTEEGGESAELDDPTSECPARTPNRSEERSRQPWTGSMHQWAMLFINCMWLDILSMSVEQ